MGKEREFQQTPKQPRDCATDQKLYSQSENLQIGHLCQFSTCIELRRFAKIILSLSLSLSLTHSLSLFIIGNRFSTLTGRLHVPIVGPTGRSDWSVRLVGPTIVPCKRFVRPVGQTVGCLISSDCRSDCRSVWTLRPTGRTDRPVADDQSRCSVGGTTGIHVL